MGGDSVGVWVGRPGVTVGGRVLLVPAETRAKVVDTRRSDIMFCVEWLDAWV